MKLFKTRGTRMTKKDLLSGKIYWSKKPLDTKFRFLLEIAGESPFLYVKRGIAIVQNGDTSPLETDITKFKDEFYDSNYPTV
jgi:hypothetical protein